MDQIPADNEQETLQNKNQELSESSCDDEIKYMPLELMEAALPPSHFTGAISYQDQQTLRKGQKETYYCELCMIALNSRDTKLAHEKGREHARKAEDQQIDLRNARWRGTFLEEKKIKRIANPLPLQKKVPVRLVEKLRETIAAVVGLDAIHEIIACSNAEVEPYYICTLCGNQGEANAMFQHLQGKPHRANFLQYKYPDNRRYIDASLNHGLLEREIERLNLRENIDLDKINTVYSDEMFPWTAGKAPWSVEQGGTGHVPTKARNRVGLISQNNDSQLFGARKANSEESEKNIMYQYANQDTFFAKIKNDTDKKYACVLVQKVTEKIRDYTIEQGICDPYQIETLCDEVEAIMEVLSLKNASRDGGNMLARNSPPLPVNSVKRQIPPRSFYDYSRQQRREKDHDAADRNSGHGRSSRNGREDNRERDYTMYKNNDR